MTFDGPDGVALLIALFLAVLVMALLGAHRPLGEVWAMVRRMLATTLVFARYLAEGLWRRLRGERDLGPELVRRAFEDLGPTYIKLGQIVASSHGLFPQRYTVEFQKCLDRVRPFSFAEVQETI